MTAAFLLHTEARKWTFLLSWTDTAATNLLISHTHTHPRSQIRKKKKKEKTHYILTTMDACRQTNANTHTDLVVRTRIFTDKCR